MRPRRTHRCARGGDFRISGILQNGGEIAVLDASARIDGGVNISSAGRIFVNDGTLRFNGSLSNSGNLSVTFGEANVFGDIANIVGGKIILSSASQTTFYDDLINAGELRVAAGSSATFFGAVSGPGSYTGTGTKYYEGSFDPGSSPGLVTDEGNAWFGTGSEVVMEIAGLTQGKDYDHNREAGTLGLGGTLRLHVLDSFAPGAGDVFDLFDAGDVLGEFSDFDPSAAPLASGLVWDMRLLQNQGVLSVVSAVPLPAGAWLAASALFVLAPGVRRSAPRRVRPG